MLRSTDLGRYIGSVGGHCACLPYPFYITITFPMNWVFFNTTALLISKWNTGL
jgi:hypothetical protein